MTSSPTTGRFSSRKRLSRGLFPDFSWPSLQIRQKLVTVRNNNGSELISTAFREVCDANKIWQEFTTPDPPKLNGVAERGLDLITESAQATVLETIRLFRDVSISTSGYL